MLNPFPIQFLALFAYMLLRMIIGGMLVYLGLKHLDNHTSIETSVTHIPNYFKSYIGWGLALFEMVIGTMLFVGFYTQIAALLAMVLAVKLIVFQSWIPSPHIPSRMFYVLLFACSLSLFITGAGAFAFDLPI